MKVWAESSWIGAFQIQIREDGFNREKRDAKSKQNDRVGRELLAYQTLISSDVVDIHKYQGIERKTEHLRRMLLQASSIHGLVRFSIYSM